jgi:hypothetical protein
MRRTRRTDLVKHRQIAADDIDTDKDVNVAGEFLREDAFDRLPQRWPQNSRYDHRDIHCLLEVGVGVGAQETLHREPV